MSTLLAWVALGLPGIYLLLSYVFGYTGYGEFIHSSGQWSVGLLLLALSVSPLRRLFADARWPIALSRQRRAIGVTSFGYALLHTLVYLEYKWGSQLILTEALRPGLASGWAAFALMLLLALTSNNYSVAKLGRRWKPLHRWVYIGAALTFAHWLLTTIELLPAIFCLLLLCLLQSTRVFQR